MTRTEQMLNDAAMSAHEEIITHVKAALGESSVDFLLFLTTFRENVKMANCFSDMGKSHVWYEVLAALNKLEERKLEACQKAHNENN